MIWKTKTKPQETLEIKLFKQMVKQFKQFSLSTPKNLSEEGKWLLAVTFFQATSSVFNINNQNNSFSITTLGHWSKRRGAETIHKLQRILELRSQNDFELHVDEVKKKEIK